MSDLFWPLQAQMRRIEPFFRFRTVFPVSMTGAWRPGSSSSSGMVFAGAMRLRRMGRRRRSTTASSAESPMGVFDRIFAGLAAQGGEPGEVMIDATHLHTLRPMRPHLLLSRMHRSNRHMVDQRVLSLRSAWCGFRSY